MNEEEIEQREFETEHLVRLSGKVVLGAPDIDAVKQCVANGADVMARSDGRPLLSVFILNDSIETALVCLQTPYPIDFTLSVEDEGDTALHYIACLPDPFISARLLAAVLDHLAIHEEDKVDWAAQNSGGVDCLSLAAHYGHLSLWWPLIMQREVEYYLNRTNPIRLSLTVERSDYERLSEEDQRHFTLDAGFIEEMDSLCSA